MEVDDGRKKAVVEELVRGREFANQLRHVVFIDDDDDELATTANRHHHLVNNVLNSFTNALFLLLDSKQQHPTNQVSSISQRDDDHFSFIGGSPLALAAKSDEEYSQESCKSTSPAGRGCYKRRKTTQTWEKVSEGPPTDDGYQWRKYGQKMILKWKYARNYYRCTHKVDQTCQATKQVQRIQEKPPLYKTTYYGHHTCKNLLLQNPEDFILQLDDDHTSSSSSSILLSFDNYSTFLPPTKQDWPFISSSNFSKDCREEVPSSSFDDHCLLSPDPTLDHSSTLQSEYQDQDIYDVW